MYLKRKSILMMFSLLIVLMVLPIAMAEIEVGYSGDETTGDRVDIVYDEGVGVVEGANYSINVNNTEHLEGYTVATLWTYFTGLGDALWCTLTGCTMAGDIDMNGNELQNAIIPDANLSGSYGYKDIRGVTLTICANDSLNKGNCDYQCDGVADQVEIQSAINSLTNGGEVKLLDGNYFINSTINLNKTNLILNGNDGTFLHMNTTSPISIRTSNIKLNNLNIDFEELAVTSSIIVILTGETISNIEISNNNLIGTSSGSIYTRSGILAFTLGGSSVINSKIYNNVITNTSTGIEFLLLKNTILKDNVILSCYGEGGIEKAGIFIEGNNNIISNNIITGCDYGIVVSKDSQLISGNHLNGTIAGLSLGRTSTMTNATNTLVFGNVLNSLLKSHEINSTIFGNIIAGEPAIWDVRGQSIIINDTSQVTQFSNSISVVGNITINNSIKDANSNSYIIFGDYGADVLVGGLRT